MPPQGAPAAPGQQPPQPGQPQVARQPERDYDANPLGEQDMEQLNQFTIMATKLIHNPQTRDKILGRIKGVEHPYDEIADASLIVMNRLEQEAQKTGQPWDKAIKLMGGMEVVGQVIEVATAAGKIPEDVPEEDKRIILGQAVQKYYQQKLATGEITKEEAARDAHIAAMGQAGMEGANTDQINQRIRTTDGMRRKTQNVAAASEVPGKLQAPQPAANPMQPGTTMKEVLAAGQGGLLDG
jgi:hypothetical protein